MFGYINSLECSSACKNEQWHLIPQKHAIGNLSRINVAGDIVVHHYKGLILHLNVNTRRVGDKPRDVDMGWSFDVAIHDGVKESGPQNRLMPKS